MCYFLILNVLISPKDFTPSNRLLLLWFVKITKNEMQTDLNFPTFMSKIDEE